MPTSTYPAVKVFSRGSVIVSTRLQPAPALTSKHAQGKLAIRVA